MRRRDLLAAVLPSLLLAALLLAPFHDKAFTIDDTLFLRMAEHALTDPLHPTAFNIVWFEKLDRASSIIPTGPVMAYLLVPAVLLGGAEWAGHAVVWLFLALGLAATVALALRLGLGRRQAAMGALLVAATPAVLGMAGTCMPDVPAMSLGVVAMERLVAWRASRRWHAALATVLAVALAVLTRSHMVMLVAVGGVALTPLDELFAWRAWLGYAPWLRLLRRAWPLFAGLGLAWLGTMLVRDRDAAGSDVATAVFHFLSLRSLDRHLVAYFVHWTLALPLGVPWMVVRWRALPWRLFWIALPVEAILLAAAAGPGWIVLAPVAAAGLVALVDVFLDGWQRRDGAQLVLAAWLLLALPVMTYANLASKYLLPSAPAVALLVVMVLARASPSRSRVTFAASLAVGAALGTAILRGDAASAGFERSAAAELVAPAVAEGKRVWLGGHWGWQWYAERAGGVMYTNGQPTPPAGDLLVVDVRADTDRLILPAPHLSLVRTLRDGAPRGRTMSKRDGAGFYSDHWGFLPWSWGRGDDDRIEVYQLK